ncbi:MAG: GldG family protein [Magnetococcales bacterium]|nr:GldG family protein [Magnetococcales bacterium]NGZ06726.1 GldG family protein [Magnetococcales bacterium]
MKMDRATRLNLRSQNFVLGVILTVLLALAAYASHRYPVRWDWTRGGLHTLAEQSLKAVKSFPDGVTMTAYIQERGDRRQQIQDLLEKYQVANPGVTLRYVDPDLDPAAARQAEVAVYGTVILRAGEKTEKITEATEEAVTNGLIRLAKGSTKTIRFISGHGEHPLDATGDASGKDRFAYVQAKALLKGEGYQVESLNLAEQDKVPDNTSVLILAGPRKPLLEIETQRLTQWMETGGRLLVMVGPGSKAGIDGLLKSHGITVLKGVTLDPTAQMIGGSAATPLISRYPSDHAITKGMSAATIFPDTGGLELDPSPDGKEQRMALLEGAARGWLETGALTSGSVEFNPDQDRKGPILIGTAIQADKKRLVVMANSNFAADAYVGALGNADLFLNITRWLAEDEDFIAIKPKEIQDSGLNLPAGSAMLLFWGLVVIIPVALLAMGGAIWYQRRRR